jgi:hypothetical protein
MKTQIMKTQTMKTQIIKSNTASWISSLLLVAITSCSSGGSTPAPGGDTGPVTTGTLTASFSNPTGTPTIGLTAFSATAGANKSTGVNATVIAGKMGNRLLTLQFSPILTGNRTCTLTADCGIALVENGANAVSTSLTLNASLSGGKLTVTGTAKFKQTNGGTFDAEVNASVPYTP